MTEKFHIYFKNRNFFFGKYFDFLKVILYFMLVIVKLKSNTGPFTFKASNKLKNSIVITVSEQSIYNLGQVCHAMYAFIKIGKIHSTFAT